jgi:hypothetical protein
MNLGQFIRLEKDNVRFVSHRKKKEIKKETKKEGK